MTEALFSIAEIHSFLRKKHSLLLSKERSELLHSASRFLDDYVTSSWASVTDGRNL